MEKDPFYLIFDIHMMHQSNSMRTWLEGIATLHSLCLSNLQVLRQDVS